MNQPGSFPFSTSDRARSKKMAPITTSREEFGKQVTQLTTVVLNTPSGLWVFLFVCFGLVWIFFRGMLNIDFLGR